MFYTYAFYMWFLYTHPVFPSSGNILAHETHLKGSFSSRAERIVLSPKLDYNTRKATKSYLPVLILEKKVVISFTVRTERNKLNALRNVPRQIEGICTMVHVHLWLGTKRLSPTLSASHEESNITSDSLSFRLGLQPADHSSYKHLPQLYFPTPGWLSAWQQDDRSTKPKYPYVGIAASSWQSQFGTYPLAGMSQKQPILVQLL